MLEKNKDYLEMRVSSTECAFAQNEWSQVRVDGYIYNTTYVNIPDPGELYVFISKEKFERLQAENEELKKKLNKFDPMPEVKELLKNLYSTEDVEKLEWTLNHVCGGRSSVNGWWAVSSFWKRNYKILSKLVGFSSVEEIQDYLTNEAEADTLYEGISKLKDQVKYTCDEWYSANSRNNSWKAAAECNSPKELIEKRETIEKEIQVYSRALQEWKEITGYPSPSAVKTALESGASWCHAYNEIKKANEKLADDVKSWKNVTGYSTPEDYMHARISGAFHTPSDYTAAWQKATGCDTSEAAKCRINNLIGEAEAWESDYNHLLALTGFDNEGEIEDFLEQNNDRNKLTTVIDNLKLENEAMKTALRVSNLAMQKELENNIDEWQKFAGCDSPQESGCKINRLCDDICKLKGDYDNLLKLTGYKSKHDIRVMLNDSEQFVYKDMRELINSLKRKAKFTESNWQTVTGFSIPEKCSSYIDRLEKKLEDIKNLTEED